MEGVFEDNRKSGERLAADILRLSELINENSQAISDGAGAVFDTIDSLQEASTNKQAEQLENLLQRQLISEEEFDRQKKVLLRRDAERKKATAASEAENQ